jgi:hypothetical protein
MPLEQIQPKPKYLKLCPFLGLLSVMKYRDMLCHLRR